MSCSRTSQRLRQPLLLLRFGLCTMLGAAALPPPLLLATEPPPLPPPGDEAPEAEPHDPVPPEERAAIEAFLHSHVAHANDGDVDAYVADFVANHSDADFIRAYAQRVVSQHAASIEVLELEVAAFRRDTAKLRVVQRTSWTDDEGRAREDLVELRYSLRKDDGKWRIIGTTRERVH